MTKAFVAVAWTCAALAVAIVLPGCSSGSDDRTAHLSGAITLGDQSIPPDAWGSIVFAPTQLDQASIASSPIVNGRYDVPNVPLGPVKVTFRLQRTTGRQVQFGEGAATDEYDRLVPEKYDEGIPLEVTGDNDQQNFDLAE